MRSKFADVPDSLVLDLLRWGHFADRGASLAYFADGGGFPRIFLIFSAPELLLQLWRALADLS